MKNKIQFLERMNKLDTRQNLIALSAILKRKSVSEAIDIAESSPMWENLKDFIGILSQESIDDDSPIQTTR